MKIKAGILLFAFFLLIYPVKADAANVSDYAAVFDAKYYYNQYPDLQAAIGNDANNLLTHFITCGMKEGRIACAGFNVKAYMANNADLQTAFGTENLEAYYEHYMKYGKKEGRIATGTVKAGNNKAVVSQEDLLATYSTKYKQGINRASNIELSAGRLNGFVIQPKQEFSFSKSILPRTAENGYLSAPSYLNKQVVQSIGGGICQVSSTLYAALKSYGIPVTERHEHSLPVDYLPTGYDATVSEGTKDLRFVNNYSYPIRIQTETKDGVLTMSVYKAK